MVIYTANKYPYTYFIHQNIIILYLCIFLDVTMFQTVVERIHRKEMLFLVSQFYFERTQACEIALNRMVLVPLEPKIGEWYLTRVSRKYDIALWRNIRATQGNLSGLFVSNSMRVNYKAHICNAKPYTVYWST